MKIIIILTLEESNYPKKMPLSHLKERFLVIIIFILMLMIIISKIIIKNYLKN